MRPRISIMLLIALPCMFFILSVDAAAQVGRLGGTVAYYAGGRVVAASGVRVMAVGSYARAETRTDSNGSFVLILRAGGYNVLAQGAYGFVQAQQVTGYVAANSDSYISPNPLYLVPQSGRSTGDPIAPPPSETVTLSESAQEESQHVQTFVTTQRLDNADTGDLLGRVVYKQTGKPASNIEVEAKGAHGRRHGRTVYDGTFEIKSMKAGQYELNVRPPAGFRQETVVVAIVGGNNGGSFPTIMLIPK